MLKKLYDRNEVTFAIFWIVLYCVLTVPVRGQYGDESPLGTVILAAIAAGLFLFIRKYHLEEKYGLTSWPRRGRTFLYFIPLWIFATGNLWGGFDMAYSGYHQLCAVLSMAMIGYIEEVIFRGFLFRGMLPRDGVKVSVIVSAVTFGAGHIVNLFAGQTSPETILQIVFAIAAGFLFTMVFYKSGSLFPCIIAHSLVDVFSKMGKENDAAQHIYIIVTIIMSCLYCIYLAKLKSDAFSTGIFSGKNGSVM